MTKWSLGRLALPLLAAFAGMGAAPAPIHAPVFKEDFADPFILVHKGEFIGYATNRGINLPMAKSRNLVDWQYVTDPADPKKLLDGMPQLGAWARKDFTWAPDVIEIGGRFLLYYTARHAKDGIQCVGVAEASSPTGPFRDPYAAPLVCQKELGGTIDAHPFRDTDGQLYLYYKNDGNNPRFLKPSQIWAQKLSPDGLKLVGESKPLIKNDVHWEWRVVEAPAMVRRPDGGYTLFFSANHFGWEADQRLSNYATGYAQCEGPMGPCTDAAENPILHSYNTRKEGCLSGPGHPTLFNAAGRTFIGFHAWAASAGCRKLQDKRLLYIAPVIWKDGKPQIGVSVRPKAK